MSFSGGAWRCELHGAPGASADPVTEAARTSQSVFISYGRADAFAFVTRLAADLRKHGHRIWVDVEHIEHGGLFDVRIEQGIRASEVFIAVMTRRSLDDDSVCRDEVVFALNENKEVVPVRADSDPKLKPTLFLARRNWIDFTESYEVGLDALLGYLSGDSSGLRPPRLPVVAGREPLDFSVEIAKYSSGFVGREWLNDEVERWLAAGRHRAFVIVGDPGIGKSAIAAWLSVTRQKDVVAAHFCTANKSRSRDPFEFVASLVGQLQARLSDYATEVEKMEPAMPRDKAADMFRELVVEPSRRIARPDTPLLVIVDALDEAARQEGETVVDVLANQAFDLPSWLRLVTTTRPEESVLERIRTLSVFELRADRPENLADVGKYVRARLSMLAGDESKVIEAVGKIERLADGNFLYVRLVLDAIEDGSLTIDEVGRLAPGLAAFYVESFRRRFPNTEEYLGLYAPILRLLVASREPIELNLIEQAIAEEPEQLRLRLLKLRPYLRVTTSGQNPRYGLFHRSIIEWLTDEEKAGGYYVSHRKGHEKLAEVCWAEYRRGDGLLSAYGRAHLAMHLVEAGRLEDLYELVFSGDLGLLARWKDGGESEAGLICLNTMISHFESKQPRSVTAAGLATQAAQIHSRRGDYERAEESLNYALARTSWSRGRRERAIAIHELASLRIYQGRYDEAAKLYKSALRLSSFGLSTYRNEAAANLVALATVELENYRFSKALSYAARAMKLAERAKDLSHLIAAIRLVASTCRIIGRYDDAAQYIDSAVAVCDARGARLEKCRLQLLRGWMNYDRSILDADRVSKAADEFRAALGEASVVNSYYSMVDSKLGLAWCALAEEDAGGGREWLDQTIPLVTPERHFGLRAGALLGLAFANMFRDELEVAERGCLEVVTFCDQKSSKGWGARARVVLGALQWHSGRRDLAEHAFKEAIRVAGEISPARQTLTRASIEACRKSLRTAPR